MTTLYRAYDAAARLLYVGISDGPLTRLGQHAASGWARHVATITFERHSDRETAAAAEGSAIRDEDPVWNLDGRPAERFMQWMAAYPENKHADDISHEQLEAISRELNQRITALLAPRSGAS